jgi:mRNA interferase RelE/StbE
VSERPWRVELAPAAERQLRKLPPADTARLRGPILALATNSRSGGAARLADGPFWRLRTGDLRVVYLIDEEPRLVVGLRVARRAESTYRRVR